MSGAAPPAGISNYYIYKPVRGASIAFAVLFAVSGIAHIWQNNLKYRSIRIGFLLPWAALIFTAGFILREYGTYHTDNLDIFIASNVLLFVAPPVYNGANYFVFGRGKEQNLSFIRRGCLGSAQTRKLEVCEALLARYIARPFLLLSLVHG